MNQEEVFEVLLPTLDGGFITLMVTGYQILYFNYFGYIKRNNEWQILAMTPTLWH